MLVEHNSIQHNTSVFHRECGWQALWVVIVQHVSGTNWLIQKGISCLRLGWLSPSTGFHCQSASVCPDLFHFDTEVYLMPVAEFHWEILPLWNQTFKILIKKHFPNSTKERKGNLSIPLPFLLTTCLSLFFIQINRAL